MIDPLSLQLTSAEKLEMLRRLDRYREWASLDDRRLCLECGKIITGQQMRVSGGSGAFDPIQASCPSEGCVSMPMDWALPESPVTSRDDSRPGWSNLADRPAVADSTNSGALPATGEAEALAESILYRA